MASCSQDSDLTLQEDAAISFSISAPECESTRASYQMTTSNLMEFGVYAFNHDTQDVFMDKTKIVNNSWGSGGGMLLSERLSNRSGWDYANQNEKKYWPNDYNLDFYAVYPFDDIIVDYFDGCKRLLDYEVDKKGNNVDLLYATEIDHSKPVAVNYPLLGGGGEAGEMGTRAIIISGGSSSRESVILNFRHALAGLTLKVKSEVSGRTIIIDGIEICNVKNKGNFTFPKESTIPRVSEWEEMIPSEESYGNWDIANSPFTDFDVDISQNREMYFSYANKTFGLYNNSWNSSEYIFMMPQSNVQWSETNSNGFYFNVKCRVLENGLYMLGSANAPAEIKLPMDIEWQQGKSYTYTFVFGIDAYPVIEVEYDMIGVEDYTDVNAGVISGSV